MSLTSYRAAPPRGGRRAAGSGGGGRAAGRRAGTTWRSGGRPADPAATRSPAPWGAVPWARRGFTAEFGMGSGGAPALSAAGSGGRPPGRAGRARPVSVGRSVVGRSAGGRAAGAVVGSGSPPRAARRPLAGGAVAAGGVEVVRAIRTGQLRASPRVHTRPIDVVVSHGPWLRGLVLGGASRLDAFSGYPARAWPPGCAAGATTGPPEARPPRSSRTGGGSPQASDARGR